jgi:hypothetical protein
VFDNTFGLLSIRVSHPSHTLASQTFTQVPKSQVTAPVIAPEIPPNHKYPAICLARALASFFAIAFSAAIPISISLFKALNQSTLSSRY